MKKSFLLVLGLLVLVVALIGCAPKAHVAEPTHFVCYQQGVAIVDTITVDGAQKMSVDNGEYTTRSWVWDDASGHHVLDDQDSVSCSQSTVER